jgi:Cu/Ag efflux protein CusF
MKSTMKIRFLSATARCAMFLALLAVAAQIQAQAPKLIQGTITALNGNTLSVKIDVDGIQQVDVPSTAAILRVAPDAKNLSAAEKIQFSDLAVGDRVSVKADPSGSGPAIQALRIFAVKQSDLALKHQKDREDWQRRGAGGLVKSVDAASGVIVLTSGAGAVAKTVTVHTSKTTILRRYAQASVNPDEALPTPIDAIHVGDQLSARGDKNADGTEIAAEEVISGSFLNIAGTVTSLDAAGSTLTVKDLATKKQVTIHVTAEAQMRRLPDRMATMLAMGLKGTPGGGQGAPSGSTPPASGAWAGGPHNGPPHNGPWGGPGGQPPDPQQMLSRAPAIQLTDLQKGEAVMLVATNGATQITAVTLLAGVEPLLEAPAASQNLLSNWSMNGGSGAAEAAVQ